MITSHRRDGASNSLKSDTPRLASVPADLSAWLESFFNGRPVVQFTCTPAFYERMIEILIQEAAIRGYNPDLIVDLCGTLEFRRESPLGSRNTLPPADAGAGAIQGERDSGSALALTQILAEDDIAQLERIRDQIIRDQEERRDLACLAVSVGIPKSAVSRAAGVGRPTLDKWRYSGFQRPRLVKRSHKQILHRLTTLKVQLPIRVGQRRKLAVTAAFRTMKTTTISLAAGVTRPTVDRWIANATKEKKADT